MVALLLLIILQVADGLFTLHGVNAVGIDKYESNPLMIFYMHRFGILESILAAKLTASLLAYVLYRHKVLNALWLLNGFYLNNLYNQIMFLAHYSG